jgi:hypothetical protein
LEKAYSVNASLRKSIVLSYKKAVKIPAGMPYKSHRTVVMQRIFDKTEKNSLINVGADFLHKICQKVIFLGYGTAFFIKNIIIPGFPF